MLPHRRQPRRPSQPSCVCASPNAHIYQTSWDDALLTSADGVILQVMDNDGNAVCVAVAASRMIGMETARRESRRRAVWVTESSR